MIALGIDPGSNDGALVVLDTSRRPAVVLAATAWIRRKRKSGDVILEWFDGAGEYEKSDGYDPISDVKALMALNLTRKGPDVVAVGDGKDSCIVNRGAVKTLNLGSWGDCTKTTSMDTVSYLLATPVPPRANGRLMRAMPRFVPKRRA